MAAKERAHSRSVGSQAAILTAQRSPRIFSNKRNLKK
jgi:hypothetical protein